MFKPFVKFMSLALIMTLAITAGVQTAYAAKKHNVVIHVTESNPAMWNQALNNAANLQKAMGKKNINVEIVVNGPGLDMMMFDSKVANRMTKALADGVTLAACAGTMKARHVSKKDLHDGVTVVRGGVIEIMEKQEAGWTYIKI